MLLASPAQSKLWPKERHKNESGTPLLRGKAEGTGVVQPEDENALERPYCNLLILKRGFRKMGTNFLAGNVGIRKGVMVLS